MSDKQFKNVAIEREDGITFVVLNRPEKRNAMSPELHYDMDAALDWLAQRQGHQGPGARGCGRSVVRRSGSAAVFPRHRERSGGEGEGECRQPFLALAEAFGVSQGHHRDGERLLLRRRLHPALRLRFRHHGRGRDLRPLRGELGHHPGRRRQLEPGAIDTAAPCAVLRRRPARPSTASAPSSSALPTTPCRRRSCARRR